MSTWQAASPSKTDTKPETAMSEPTGDEYQAHLIMIYTALNMLSDLPLKEMRQQQERAHAFGPILDPTLYREKLDAFKQDAEVTGIALETAEKFRKFREALRT